MHNFNIANMGVCDGTETSYLDCESIINTSNCQHSEDLGIVCGSMNEKFEYPTGTVRILDPVINDDDSESGLLLVYYEGWGWGTFCDDALQDANARTAFLGVVAGELDYDYCEAYSGTSSG